MKLSFSALLTAATNLILNWRREFALSFLISAALIAAGPLFSKIGTDTVLIARQDLKAGITITANDFEKVSIPSKYKAPNAILESELIELVLHSDLQKGEQLTSSRFMEVNFSDKDFVPVRITDAQIIKIIKPGQIVDIVASSDTNTPARLLAQRVKIVALYPESQSFTNTQGVLVLVAAETHEAVGLAGSGNLKLSLVIRGQ
jgi:Flp pilus assembly protein CpaB